MAAPCEVSLGQGPNRRGRLVDQFDPLRAPSGGFPRVSKVDRLVRHLAVAEYRDVHDEDQPLRDQAVEQVGIGGAARLNDLIHERLPKTYIAVGKLVIETPTGDPTSEIIQKDDSLYLKNEIARFPVDFIEERLRQKFLVDYWQAPHKYSASKFM
jgi:hypothetical protein